jgi:hypothetical protein
MQLEDYKNELQQRYLSLDEDQKEKVREFKNSEVSEIFSYLLGPELNPLLSMLRSPTPKQGSALTVIEESQPMSKGGLVSRPKKSVAKKK